LKILSAPLSFPVMSQRLTVRFEGRVQGVGFRFTCVNLAADFDVAGFVKNEPDGSVTLIAEGEENQIMGLLGAIRSSPLGRHITGEQTRRSSATGEFSGFTVRY
jgi:acylphosphatase